MQQEYDVQVIFTPENRQLGRSRYNTTFTADSGSKIEICRTAITAWRKMMLHRSELVINRLDRVTDWLNLVLADLQYNGDLTDQKIEDGLWFCASGLGGEWYLYIEKRVSRQVPRATPERTGDTPNQRSTTMQTSELAEQAICFAAETISNRVQLSLGHLDDILSGLNRPSVKFRPKLSRNGDKWIALYGDDLQTGVVGIGGSPGEAMFHFDNAWEKRTSNQ